jgi:hypothetical protein
MNRWNRVLILMLTIGMASSVCFALVTESLSGDWPESWPKELEPLRSQARTVHVGHGIQETVYEIPFKSREEFEKVWPYILKVKSKGAPIILENSPSTYSVSGTTMTTGVRILWPSGGTVELPDRKRLEAKEPWPDYIKNGAGELPEYVTEEHGKWIPNTPGKKPDFFIRARVDIILVTDGRVIDLNRIELPGETPIVDRRFKR